MNRIYTILLLLAVVFCSGCKKQSEDERLEIQLIGTWDYDYSMRWRYEQISGELVRTTESISGQDPCRINFHPDGVCEIFPAIGNPIIKGIYQVEDDNLFVGGQWYGKIAVDGYELILIQETVDEATATRPAYLNRDEIYYRHWN